MGIVSLATGGVTIATGSSANRVSPDVIAKSNADTSSLSPVPYVFSRGRKASTALEKVAERRQRRMIKNRESAARSRTLKQVSLVTDLLHTFQLLNIPFCVVFVL
jgi:ABA responsive element binding factor